MTSEEQKLISKLWRDNKKFRELISKIVIALKTPTDIASDGEIIDEIMYLIEQFRAEDVTKTSREE